MAENPVHWFAQDCYVQELANIFKEEKYADLPLFLRRYPYTVLDEFVVSTLAADTDFFRGISGMDQAAIAAIEEEWELRKLILVDNSAFLGCLILKSCQPISGTVISHIEYRQSHIINASNEV